MSIISTHGLTRRYGTRTGVEGIDLEVPEGVLFGFLGPNGSGKTTTIRLLLGFLRPSAGAAQVMGLDCWRRSAEIKREVGYLPGDLRLYPWMTGRSALRMVGLVRGRDLRKPGADLAARFDLDLNVPVRKMSRGMRQKLGLICALAPAPQLLILDEPTSGLDPLMQDVLTTRLRELASNGHTVFFSSHTLSEVEQLCDRVAIVREGRLVADETLLSLRRSAQREVRLVFNSAEAAEHVAPPECLEALERRAEWHARLSGSALELARWAAQQPLEDLTIDHPSLESLFRQYYRSPERGG